MCYYGSQFPKGIKKDQGHFNLMSDLHTLVRDAQQNLFYGDGGKQDLINNLNKLIENVRRGEYDSKTNETMVIKKCDPLTAAIGEQ